MLQVVQDLENGDTTLLDTPVPVPGPRAVLIRTQASLISAGTERMLLEFGRGSLVEKARQQPDKVRQVIAKARTDGILPTVDAVRAKLAMPIPLGYCSAGIVEAVGAEIEDLEVGDRVACNGPHAEFAVLGRNLVAKIPSQDVSFEHAAFTPLASIALQSIRLGKPALGEVWVVSGLGLVGLLTVQLLRASGCRVIGLDFDEGRLKLGRDFGAETVDLSKSERSIEVVKTLNEGFGVDGVVIAASTPSSEPIHQAAEMCRQRGRIIMVGVTGMELIRADFYEKELSFQVSCSYGPGRYDPSYEQRGQDYPRGFVRWTEGRNFQAVLQQMENGGLDIEALISERHRIHDATRAYESLANRSALGIVLNYASPESEEAPKAERSIAPPGGAKASSASMRLGVIGTGNFVTRFLLPAFASAGVAPEMLASRGGLSSALAARKSGARVVTTETSQVFGDSGVNTVLVGTPHDSHAPLVVEALNAGKHVFVEKPLAITPEGLESVREALAAHAVAPVLTVGLNRRFSPYVQRLAQKLSGRSEPLCATYCVNAGAIPDSHWIQDRKRGGGRVVGEVCHFVDVLRFLVGAPIVSAVAVGTGNPGQRHPLDRAIMTLGFEDGSIATIQYFSNGHASFPKERLEVFSDGRVFVVDNFRRLQVFDGSMLQRPHLPKQDKGHEGLVRAFVEGVRTGQPPIPMDELFEVAEVTLDLAAQLEA
ncbi:MAG: bi-domain-containing oxidoreductase [Proteobacteria bacterium]|nr:bi-domain-containing oxidoreductase [Pseudomonadota bacterium]